jgi:hypothetical protein
MSYKRTPQSKSFTRHLRKHSSRACQNVLKQALHDTYVSRTHLAAIHSDFDKLRFYAN